MICRITLLLRLNAVLLKNVYSSNVDRFIVIVNAYRELT